MLLYLDIFDMDEFHNYLNNTNIPHDFVIRTKCGLNTECIKYLLNFSKKQKIYDNIKYENNYLFENFDPEYAYEFLIDVINKKNFIEHNEIKSIIDHQFVLLNYHEKWYLLDAYIQQKEFQYNVVDPLFLSKFITESRIKFNIDRWNQLFNVNVRKPDLRISITEIFKYKWKNSDSVRNNFIGLIDKSKNRLANETDGIDPSYLFILDKSLNTDRAAKYLDSLYGLIGFICGPE